MNPRHPRSTRATRSAGKAATLLGAAAVLAACSAGPVDQAELCAGFDTLDTELLRGNAGFGNPLFDAVEDLGDLADRYTGTGVAADAEALHAVDDDESTDSNELRNATIQISALCGRPPVGLGGLFGS
jgi:hypothetical protein